MEKEFNIKGDPSYIEILPLGSIEAVSFGNNHRMDYGQQGSDDKIGIYEAQGIRVGFISVNEVYDGEAVEAWPEDGIKQLQEGL